MRYEASDLYRKEDYDISKYELVATKAVVASQLMELENARNKIDDLNCRIKELEHFSEKDKVTTKSLEQANKEKKHANGVAIKLRHRVQELSSVVESMSDDITALKKSHPKGLVAQLEVAKNDVIKLQNENKEQEKNFKIQLDAANVEILAIKMQLSKCMPIKKPLESHGPVSDARDEEQLDNKRMVPFEKRSQFPHDHIGKEEDLAIRTSMAEMENCHLRKELKLKNSLLKSLGRQIIESRQRQNIIEAKLATFRSKATKKFRNISRQNLELKKVSFQAAERASALSQRLLKSDTENNVLKKELSSYVLKLLNDTKPITKKKVREDVRRIQKKVPSMIEFVEVCNDVEGNAVQVPQVIECITSDDEHHSKSVKCIHTSINGIECVPVLSEDRDVFEVSISSQEESLKTYWDASISTQDVQEV